MAGRRRKKGTTKFGSAKRRRGRIISVSRRASGSKVVSGGANPFSQRTRTRRGKGQRRDRKGRFA